MIRHYSYRLEQPIQLNSGVWQCQYVILDSSGSQLWGAEGVSLSRKSPDEARSMADAAARQQVAALAARAGTPPSATMQAGPATMSFNAMKGMAA